jgi:very-short-patch-repair endonuclease
MRLRYNPELKQLASELRKNGTLAEVILWNNLKHGKILGCDFHRQKPIGNYIVDFFCFDRMLAIEIDGATHGDRLIEDEKRQKELENMGVKFLRFRDSSVKNNLDDVLRAIQGWLEDNKA